MMISFGTVLLAALGGLGAALVTALVVVAQALSDEDGRRVDERSGRRRHGVVTGVPGCEHGRAYREWNGAFVPLAPRRAAS